MRSGHAEREARGSDRLHPLLADPSRVDATEAGAAEVERTDDGEEEPEVTEVIDSGEEEEEEGREAALRSG